jgi:hypothetical protein
MTSNKLTLIMGGRDQVERDLVLALYGEDNAEIERLSVQLDAIAKKFSPKLTLVKTPEE